MSSLDLLLSKNPDFKNNKCNVDFSKLTQRNSSYQGLFNNQDGLKYRMEGSESPLINNAAISHYPTSSNMQSPNEDDVTIVAISDTDVNMTLIRQNRTKHLHNLMNKLSKCLRNVLCGLFRHGMEQRIQDILLQYISSIKEIFNNVSSCSVACHMLSKHLIRTLDLIHSVHKTFSDTYEYMYRMSEIVSFYVSCEIALSHRIRDKHLIVNKIACVIKRYLEVPFEENLSKSNILRMFILINDKYKDPEIIIPLYRSFIPQPIIVRQKELPDKLYIQYIIIFYLWIKQESSVEGKEMIIAFAEKFMRPSKTLCMNSIYAYHLPKYSARLTATRYILENLKFFNDLQNASIYDNSLKNMKGIIDFSAEDPILASRKIMPLPLTYSGNDGTIFSWGTNKSIKLEEPTVVDVVDLTKKNNFQLNVEVSFIHNLVKKVKDYQPSHLLLTNTEQTEKTNVIVIDSDNDSENEMPLHNSTRGNHRHDIELFSLDFDFGRNNDCQTGVSEVDWSDNGKNLEEMHCNNIIEEDPCDPTKLVCHFTKKPLRTYKKSSRLNSSLGRNSSNCIGNNIDASDDETYQKSFSPLNIDIDNDNTKSVDKIPQILEAFSCRRNSIHIKSSPTNFSNNVQNNYNDSEFSIGNRDRPENMLDKQDSLNGYDVKCTYTYNKKDSTPLLPLNKISDHVESSLPQRKQVQFSDIPAGPNLPKSKNVEKLPIKSSLASKNNQRYAPFNSSLTNYLVQRRRSLINLRNNQQSSSTSLTSSPISDILKESLRREQLNAIPKIFSNFAPFKSIKSVAFTQRKTKFGTDSKKEEKDVTKRATKRLPNNSSIECKPRKLSKNIKKNPKSKCTNYAKKNIFFLGENINKASHPVTKAKRQNVSDIDDPKLSKMQCSVVIRNNRNDVEYINSLLKSQRTKPPKGSFPISKNDHTSANEINYKSVILEKISADTNTKGSFGTLEEKKIQDSELASKGGVLNEFDATAIEIEKFPGEFLKTSFNALNKIKQDATQNNEHKIKYMKDSSFNFITKNNLKTRSLKVRVKREKLSKFERLQTKSSFSNLHKPIEKISEYIAANIRENIQKSKIEVNVIEAEENNKPSNEINLGEKIECDININLGKKIDSKTESNENCELPLDYCVSNCNLNSLATSKELNEELKVVPKNQNPKIEKTCEEIIIPPKTAPLCSIRNVESSSIGKDIIQNDLNKITSLITDSSSSEASLDSKIVNTDLSNMNLNDADNSDMKEDNSCEGTSTKEIFFMNSISERDKVLLEIEATPTVPTYLFNGESRDIPTPTPSLNPMSNRLGSPTIQTYQGDSTFCAEKQPANSLLVSTSDHEVSSTQEIIDDPTSFIHTVKASSPSPLETDLNSPINNFANFEKSLVVQNNQVDTTNNFSELSSKSSKSYSMRKRKTSVSSVPQSIEYNNIKHDLHICTLTPDNSKDLKVDETIHSSATLLPTRKQNNSLKSKETSATTSKIPSNSDKKLSSNLRKHIRTKTDNYSPLSTKTKNTLFQN